MLLRIPLPKEPQFPNLTYVFKGICCANEPGRQGWKSETPGSQDCGSCSLEKLPGKRGKEQQALWDPGSLFCDSRVTVRSPPSPCLTALSKGLYEIGRVAAPLGSRRHLLVRCSNSCVIPTLGKQSRRTNTKLRLACYEEGTSWFDKGNLQSSFSCGCRVESHPQRGHDGQSPLQRKGKQGPRGSLWGLFPLC